MINIGKRKAILAAVFAAAALFAYAVFFDTSQTDQGYFSDRYQDTIQQENRYELITNETWERNYPNVIKGSVDPGFPVMDRIFAEDVDGLKNLGVNTVAVYPYYEYRNGVPVLGSGGVPEGADAKDRYIWLIQQAKKNGFVVRLTTNFVGPGGQKFDNVSMEQFLADSKRIALEWAKTAEDYKVEYFGPQGEIDVQIFINYFNGNWSDGAELAKVVPIVNKWHDEILPDIKEVYKGKTVYQFGLNGPSFRINNIKSSGWDMLGVDFNQAGDNLEQFRQRVRQMYLDMEFASMNSGSGWFIAELWIPYAQFGTHNSAGMSFDEYQDEYFRIALEEYENFSGSIKPSGVMFVAYRTPGTDVKGRPAEQVIKEFFERL